MGKTYNLANSKESKNYLVDGGKETCGEVVAQAVKLTAKLIEKKRNSV